MQFGKAIGVACGTFAVTNIDDMFVLVTFYAEAATSTTLTPLKITVGQYLGFTIIILISMIGFAIALVVPTEPIGFLGLLPILLGVWKAVNLFIPNDEEEGDNRNIDTMKSVIKVTAITLINGGDNISTYIPLFSQAKKAEIAVYIVVYYIMLGLWCLIAYLIMGQKHLLRLVQRCVHWVLPLLYIGLGVFILISSECYPWSIERIDDKLSTHPGRLVLSIGTTSIVLLGIGLIVWVQLCKRASQSAL